MERVREIPSAGNHPAHVFGKEWRPPGRRCARSRFTPGPRVARRGLPLTTHLLRFPLGRRVDVASANGGAMDQANQKKMWRASSATLQPASSTSHVLPMRPSVVGPRKLPARFPPDCFQSDAGLVWGIDSFFPPERRLSGERPPLLWLQLEWRFASESPRAPRR